MTKVFWGGLPATLAAIGLSLPAQAETKRIENGAQFGGWTVSCEAIAVNETLCVLSQRLVRSDSNAVLAELVAFNDAEEVGAWLVARVPNGVYFPSGFVLGLEDDDARIAFEWQNCTAESCEALLALEPGHLDAFEAQGPWVAGYRPGITSDALVFRVSPQGLNEGLFALAEVLGQPGPRTVAGFEPTGEEDQ